LIGDAMHFFKVLKKLDVEQKKLRNLCMKKEKKGEDISCLSLKRANILYQMTEILKSELIQN
jgi:hypothetical protein